MRFILNYGLKPLSIKGEHINEWRWYRRSLSDLRDLLVNVIEITYDEFSSRDKRIELTIDYEGGIKDYSNVHVCIQTLC